MSSRAPAVLLATLVLALSSSACSTTYFVVQRRAPAEVNLPAGLPMAVAKVAGEEGDALASELTQALVRTQRFQVLERQRIGAAIAELRFSSEGYVSDDTAISFGEMTGAASLVVGEVQLADYQEDIREQAQECAREGKTVPCTAYTRTAKGALRVVLEVVETQTGRVLAAKTLTAERKATTQAVDQLPAPIDQRVSMMVECRAEVVEAFVKVVAPHDVAVRVALRTDDDLPQLETGNNYAMVGNWSAAVEQYRAAVERARAAALKPEQLAAATYNLGIGLGYSGDFDGGLAQIEQAFALDPDPLYREQLEVVRQYKADAAKIAEQEPGRAPTPR